MLLSRFFAAVMQEKDLSDNVVLEAVHSAIRCGEILQLFSEEELAGLLQVSVGAHAFLHTCAHVCSHPHTHTPDLVKMQA